MDKILIINLTRMGDLVQMLGLVGGLRRRWPQAQIDVLAMKAFAGILDCFPALNNIIRIDDDRLVGVLDDDLWSGYEELKRHINTLNATDYDLLISPVVSTQAAYLAYPMKSRERRGMFINRDREQTIASEWTAFHLANEHHLGDRTFNLVDIFAHIGGVAAQAEDFRLSPGDDAEHKAAALWRSRQLEGKQVVGVHAGASQSNKTWEPQRFRAVIEKLLQCHERSVVLFGGYNELSLKPYFDEINHPRFVNLIGESGLKDLLAMLRRLDLLIVNDTGPMHLAAAMKTPILNLSLGPVSLWETGPYLPGAVIAQADIDCHPCRFDHLCSHLNCHKQITPELVTATAESKLRYETPQPAQGVHLWRTRTDIFGMLHCVPTTPRPITPRELYFECKRAVWAMTLMPQLDPKVDWNAAFIADIREHYQVERQDMRDRIRELDALRARTENLVATMKTLTAQRPGGKKSIDKIRDTWAEIKRQKELLHSQAREVDLCYDFFLYARFRESSLDSNDFNRLTRDTLDIFATLCMQLQALARLITSFTD